MLGAFKASRGRGFLTDFVALEVLTVLGKHYRTGQLSKQTYRTAVAELFRDYPAGFNVVAVDDPTRRQALALAEKYREVAIGAMDLVHLASALHVQQLSRARPVVFASSDDALLGAATDQGLATFNPEKDPLANLLTALR